MIAYTSLLPTGYASGDKSPMYEDNFDKPEDSLVKDFDKIVTDRSQLDVCLLYTSRCV